ncbi:aspartate aminotransferase family protein [Plantactinospora sp. KBS50]|uniref:aspartate aminotransferase family protein n=1 Tax=Plantactinospora sp. KBS50 TaxID=2024580 RepID=UPI000BAA9CFE|nr:aminotransferase class III-fold pyridoxal phosphate-dependent enzyme [Plantactinospora sp. KBS50]ASW55661.1 aspartate aminotransferase family protein [Plantactinospora sp. KBS50]
MTTNALHARHTAVMPSWLTTYYERPLALVQAAGRHVTDQDGNRYLDFFGGILTTSAGYDVAEIRERVQRQLATGVVHTSTLYLIESQVALAERIADLAGIEDPAVFFTNSGTEANETALLAATCHRGSGHVVALTDSYHGRSFGAIGISGLEGWRPSPLSPVRLTWAGNGRRGEPAALVADLRSRLAADDEPVAALIAEPVQGLAGFFAPPPGLLRGYQEVVADQGGLLISDEVQTGWGRLGSHLWGYEYQGLRPDLITFAKGLANGFPIGGVIGRRAVIDSLAGKSISTFGGNPLSTTAALATLDHLLDTDARGNAERIGRQLLDGLRRIAARHRCVGDVRGYGLLLAVEIAAGADDGAPAAGAAAARRILERCRELGLLVGVGGRHGNVLRIAPAMTVTGAEAAEALAILDRALADESRPSAPADRPLGVGAAMA